MVTLADKSFRDTIGIDSLERAIVWSAILLRNAYSQESERALKDAFQIVPSVKNVRGELTEVMSIAGDVYFNPQALLDGGDVLANISPKSQNQAIYTGKNLLPSVGTFNVISDEPASVNSLEAYFYWSVQSLLAKDIESKINLLDTFPAFKGTGEQKKTIVASIEFDAKHFLESGNLVESVGISSSGEVPITSSSSLIGNDNLFGNSFLVGNSTNQSQNQSLIGNNSLFGNNTLIGN